MSMQATVADSGADFKAISSRLMTKVFYMCAALALLSAGISIGGKWLGRSIAMGGHTDDASLREIVIGNDVLSVPANAIRFERARRDGVAARLDLYLRWPELEGFSSAARDDFNNAGGNRSILFLTFERQIMSRDMSGRFAPIYSSLILRPGEDGPGGVTVYEFDPKSGYVDESLAVAERPGSDPFVARCLTGDSARESLAPCERDLLIGEGLSLTYRFPRELLADWRAMDIAVAARAAGFLKTAR